MNFFSRTFTLSYPKGKNRIDIYDFLRGVAMFIVMLQHSAFPGGEYLVAFHMPLFFFLSGMAAGGRELPSFHRYALSRFKRLMIPYFAFGFFQMIIYYLGGIIYQDPYPIDKGLLGLVTGQYGYVPDNKSGLYWFFYTIFVADLLLYPINKWFGKSAYAKLGGAFLFVLLSYITTHYYPISIFAIEKAFMGAAFILMGSLMKSYVDYLLQNRRCWFDVIIIVLCILSVFFSVNMNSAHVLMYLNQYGEYGWFFLGSITGIVLVIVTGKRLYAMLVKKQNVIYRMFMWIGFNSLVMFPVHLMINKYFQGLYTLIGRGTAPLRLTMMLVLGIPICNIIINYLPWVLGQKKQTIK